MAPARRRHAGRRRRAVPARPRDRESSTRSAAWRSAVVDLVAQLLAHDHVDDPRSRRIAAATAPAAASVSRREKLILRLAQHVAHAAHGVDQARLAARLQLAAEVRDVDLDRVRPGLELVAPDALEDEVAGHHLARVEHEQLEQRVLGAGEVEVAVAAWGHARVHGHVADLERLVAQLAAAAAQQGAHAGDQLVERERLDQVVVGAGVEAGDAVGDGVARREHQHRHAGARRAQPLAHLDAVDARHHQVQDDHLGPQDGDRLERLVAVGGHRDVVSVHAKRAGDCLANGRVTVGTSLFKLIGCIALLPLIELMVPPLAELNPDPARVVVNFHTGFNVALAATFILLTGPMARLLARLLPDRPVELDPSRPRHLDRSTLDTPSLALAHAAREALRMGDLIETMLRDSFEVLRRGDPEKLRWVAAMDDRVDKLHEAIKLFVTDVSREPLSAHESRHAAEILSFTTNLEHIGDIVDKSLLELAEKKIRRQLRFSHEGWSELRALHGRVLNNLQKALGVFMSRDVGIARKLIDEKVAVREAERQAAENHLARLRAGRRESIEFERPAPRRAARPQAHPLAHLRGRLPDPGRGGPAVPLAPEAARPSGHGRRCARSSPRAGGRYDGGRDCR